MGEISFYTTYLDNPYLLARAKNGSQSGLQERGCHRFGFNGKENDNEVKGTGNQQDYGMRIYDPRLGRFLSIDPLTAKFPFYTPYQFAGNTPIQAVDLDGAEPDYIIKNGKATPAVVTLLHLLVDYNVENMQNTTYVKVNSLPYDARTVGSTVQYKDPNFANSKGEYNSTRDYTDEDWIEMVGHEGKHRQDMGNSSISFLKNITEYGWEYIGNGYENNKFEKSAYAIGYGYNSVISTYLKENPWIVNVLRSNSSDMMKSLQITKMYYEDLIQDATDELTEARTTLCETHTQEEVDKMVAPISNAINSLNTLVGEIDKKIEKQGNTENNK